MVCCSAKSSSLENPPDTMRVDVAQGRGERAGDALLLPKARLIAPGPCFSFQEIGLVCEVEAPVDHRVALLQQPSVEQLPVGCADVGQKPAMAIACFLFGLQRHGLTFEGIDKMDLALVMDVAQGGGSNMPALKIAVAG